MFETEEEKNNFYIQSYVYNSLSFVNSLDNVDFLATRAAQVGPWTYFM